jgi:hypothetical protein
MDGPVNSTKVLYWLMGIMVLIIASLAGLMLNQILSNSETLDERFRHHVDEQHSTLNSLERRVWTLEQRLDYYRDFSGIREPTPQPPSWRKAP